MGDDPSREDAIILKIKSNDPSGSVLRLRAAFVSAKAPERITQDPYDGSPKYLHRLARLHPGDRAEVRDLWDYTQAVLHGNEIQRPLLACVLPFCLEAWRDDLRGTNSGYGGFVEHFYPMLANKHIFDLHLSPSQSAAVSDFMRESILEEIDDQRGLAYRGMASGPYRWIGAFTTYGVLLPEVEHLWNSWWSVETVGRAVAIVQYISCLMYPENENPVFAPWTPDGGGGPPMLWEFEGHLYSHRWLESNISFLKRALNPRCIREALIRAVNKLRNEPEYETALRILEDVELCEEILESRCSELPRILELMPETGTPLEWTV